jgi:hypothetical protein
MTTVSVARKRWSALAFASAVAAAILLALAPVVATSSCVTSSLGGAVQCSSRHTTLVDSEGAGVLAVLAVPPLVGLIPLLVPSRRVAVAVAVALTVGAVAGIASITLFFVPTVVLAWLAVAAKG